jgi:hypothetical protein
MSIRRFPTAYFSACVLLVVATTAPCPALAWGDEGYEIIALIAGHYLDPAARTKLAMLLAADTDTLTGHDIASEATWADKYQDSDRDTTRIRYEGTRLWHFVDIEVAEPTLPRPLDVADAGMGVAARSHSSFLTRRWSKPDSNSRSHLAPVTSTNGPKPSKSTASSTACATSDLPFKSPLWRQRPHVCTKLNRRNRPQRWRRRPPDGGLPGADAPGSFVLGRDRRS